MRAVLNRRLIIQSLTFAKLVSLGDSKKDALRDEHRGVTIIRTESCAKAQQMDKQTITAREKMTCPSGTKSA